MRNVQDIPEFKGARVLVRADFDVPVDGNGHITEDFRIFKQKENLDYLLSRGAKVVIIAHLSARDSFRDLQPQLRRLLGREFAFIKDLADLQESHGDGGSLYLLDNIRRWKEEVENEPAFAAEIAGGFDYFVNNAFAVSHREHASVVGLAFQLPAYAGLLIQQEVHALSQVTDAPAEGKVVVMGGAKAATKVPVIKHFLDRSEQVLLGGIIAIDIMKAKGEDIGPSRVDEQLERLLEGLDVNDPRLSVHQDSITQEEAIMDIGPESARRYAEIIRVAKTVIWNGPMGKFEDERFAEGTRSIAQAIADSEAFSLIGGGDTIAAVNRFGLLDRFDHVSTGGGAMLAFLAGTRMPGLMPLGVYTK
jgi:phosphoglycerate kinase